VTTCVATATNEKSSADDWCGTAEHGLEAYYRHGLALPFVPSICFTDIIQLVPAPYDLHHFSAEACFL
jgi:hypothetical protein